MKEQDQDTEPNDRTSHRDEAPTNNNAMLDRALAAYFKRFPDGEQPSRGMSDVEGDQVVLRCLRGELARYRVTKSGLRFVEVAS